MSKITTGIDKLDNIFKGGFDKSKITFIGFPNSGKSNMMIFDESVRDKITKQGNCIIADTIKFLNENGISTPITNTEKIGDNYFPVTYCENGTIYVDYPPAVLKKIKEISVNAVDLENFSVELTKLREKYNIKIIIPKSPIE